MKRMDDEKLIDYQTCTHRDCHGCSNRHPCRMDGGYTELAVALREAYAVIDELRIGIKTMLENLCNVGTDEFDDAFDGMENYMKKMELEEKLNVG